MILSVITDRSEKIYLKKKIFLKREKLLNNKTRLKSLMHSVKLLNGSNKGIIKMIFYPFKRACSTFVQRNIQSYTLII